MILALAIATTVTPLGAQESGGVEIGVLARYSIFDGSLPMENRLGGGARLGAFLFPQLLVEADLSYTSTVEGDETARYVPFHAYVVYSHPLSPRASLRIGAGLAHNEYPHLRDGADNGVAGLASLLVALQPSLALRMDATFDFMPVPANLAAVNFNTGVQVGLSYRLGSPGSSPPVGPVVIGAPAEPDAEPEAPPIEVDEAAGDRPTDTATRPDSAAVAPPGRTAATRADTTAVVSADSGAVAPAQTGIAAPTDSAPRLPVDAAPSPDTSRVIAGGRGTVVPADTGVAARPDTSGLAETRAAGESPEAARSADAGNAERAARAGAVDTGNVAEPADIADLEEPRPSEERYAAPLGFALPAVGESVVLEGVAFGGPRTALLTPRSQAVLNGVAAAIQGGPGGAVYEVAGYTDDGGDANFNEWLSLARANVVRWYLLGRGVDPERLVAEGYGPSRPRSNNETEQGRARNRRVELRRLR